MDPIAHSYSSVKDFEGCGRRYYNVRILRRFKQADTEATLYGTAVHKAFEEFFMHGTPLPEAYQQYAPFVNPLKGLQGELRCEEKMAVTADFKPCGFYDEKVWLRGIPDYVCLNRRKRIAHVADFKTGKSSRFADSKQLELMAALIMTHHPEIDRVKAALLFVVAGNVIKSAYTREELPAIWASWAGRTMAIEEALVNGVWNPKPSGLCKFCPVPNTDCEYKR